EKIYYFSLIEASSTCQYHASITLPCDSAIASGIARVAVSQSIRSVRVFLQENLTGRAGTPRCFGGNQSARAREPYRRSLPYRIPQHGRARRADDATSPGDLRGHVGARAGTAGGGGARARRQS